MFTTFATCIRTWPLGGAIVEPGLLARIWEGLHRWALRRATRVIVLGEDMRARIIAKGS